jgi:Tol biopolymer transport system component
MARTKTPQTTPEEHIETDELTMTSDADASDVEHPTESVVEPDVQGGAPKKKAPQAEVQFRVRRSTLWSLAISAAVVLIGLLAWQLDWYGAIKQAFNRSAVTVQITDDQGQPLTGVSIELAGSTYDAGAQSTLTIMDIQAGEYTLRGVKEGYEPVQQSINLRRADNPVIGLKLAKLPDVTYTVQGSVQDLVGNTPLVDVQVSVLARSLRTNPAGEFSFSKMAPGDYKITVSRSGYATREVPVTITTADVRVPAVSLVPTGQVLFVSNRDGKRAIYSAAFDGSEQKQLVKTDGQGEDYSPVLSPTGAQFVFSSTREGLNTNYGSQVAKLYLAARDGSGVRKVNDDIAHSRVVWSSNGRFLVYEAWEDIAFTQYVQRVYDFTRNAAVTLEAGASGAIFNPTEEQVAYTIRRQVANPTPSASPTPVATPAASPERTEFMVINPVSGDRRALYTTADLRYVERMAFTDDGRSLIIEAYTLAGTRQRFQVAIADGTRSDLSAGSQRNSDKVYQVSPDGSERIFVETRDGRSDVYLQNIRSGAERRLTTSGGVAERPLPVWDETGRYIIFTVIRENETALYIVAASGGTSRKVVDITNDTQGARYY